MPIINVLEDLYISLNWEQNISFKAVITINKYNFSRLLLEVSSMSRYKYGEEVYNTSKNKELVYKGCITVRCED